MFDEFVKITVIYRDSSKPKGISIMRLQVR